MPRKFFRRLSAPYRGKQGDTAWYLKPFRQLLAHPVYFSINRRTITGGIALGVLIGVLPFLGHTPVVVLAALLLRVNLPVAVLATWVANPLTYGPIFYGEYLLGAYLLSEPPSDLGLSLGAHWRDFLMALVGAWRPLWLGAVVSGLMLAGLAYVLSNAAWRLMTRWRLQRRGQRRSGIPRSHP
ncbi:MAG: DUF2062 domain-containing protein [Gammaproteobacteria bacterium]